MYLLIYVLDTYSVIRGHIVPCITDDGNLMLNLRGRAVRAVWCENVTNHLSYIYKAVAFQTHGSIPFSTHFSHKH